MVKDKQLTKLLVVCQYTLYGYKILLIHLFVSITYVVMSYT